uniref:FBA_2 domain-containing protein n=1 Tax=Panagrellus redivivus TaxID=6233 RepID=A0A7E4VNI2_PANRE
MVKSPFDCIFPFNRSKKPTSEPQKCYPLLKLSGETRIRLRELASPLEAYNLQRADIDQTMNLVPFQYTIRGHFRVDEFGLHRRAPIGKTALVVDSNTLYTAETLEICNITFDNPIFGHLILNSSHLTFTSCNLDQRFLDALKLRLTGTCFNLKLQFCNLPEPNTLTKLAEAVPSANMVYIQLRNCENWYSIVLNANKTWTFKVELHGTLEDILRDITIEDFCKLLNTDYFGTFTLEFHIQPETATWEDTEAVLVSYFDGHFRSTEFVGAFYAGLKVIVQNEEHFYTLIEQSNRPKRHNVSAANKGCFDLWMLWHAND